MNDERPDLATALGRLLGMCSIAAIMILWMAFLTYGIGRLFGQDWTFASVAFWHLLGLAFVGFVGTLTLGR